MFPVTMKPDLILKTVAGPTTITVPVCDPGTLTFGRHPGHSVHLNHPLVSRNHAVLKCEDTRQPSSPSVCRWLLQDLGSVHGVRLNGMKLRGNEAYHVQPGDLIAIEPWTFRLADAQGESSDTTVPTRDDEHAAHCICSLDGTAASDLPQKQLSLLLGCVDLVHQADDPVSLANVVLDTAVAGTGFSHGAWIREMEPDSRVNLIAHHGPLCDETGIAHLSRSLIRRSLQGVPVYYSRKADPPETLSSVALLGIEEACCLPIRYSSTTVGFLYLDRRRPGDSEPRTLRDVEGFLLGLVRLAGVAMSNLLRLDLERRHTRITTELETAAKVQQLILPPRYGVCGRFRHEGASIAGLHLGGDFFDVIQLLDDRLAITIGDVCGKGVAASFVMAVTQGFLHHALRASADPQAAIIALNEFLLTRLDPGTFVSLWVGVLDGAHGKLTYVDAGHGYAFLLEPHGIHRRLTTDATLLIGISPDGTYKPRCLDLPASGTIALLSDGVVEQRPLVSKASDVPMPSVSMREELGVDAIIEFLQHSGHDDDVVSTLFNMVRDYAGRSELDDDATVLMVRW